MRKLFYLLTSLMVVSFMSCDPKDKNSQDSNVDLIYNVTASAEGQVEFSWFNGGAKVNGDALIRQCNDSTNLLKSSNGNIVPLSTALESKTKLESDAAKYVLSFIKVNGIEDNYHLMINGYVKYGPIILRIDEEYPSK